MIHKIHVNALFNAPIDEVFESISDHPQFLSGGGLQCQLLQTGDTETNGKGAVRMISSPKIQFEEKITAFNAPKHYAYLITSTQPHVPIKHIKGWLDFVSVGEQTQVDWHSHFEVSTFLVGPVIGWVMKRQLSKVFHKRLTHQHKKWA